MKRIPGLDPAVIVASVFAIGAPIYLGLSAIKLNDRVQELETTVVEQAARTTLAVDTAAATSLAVEVATLRRENRALRDSLAKERARKAINLTDSSRPRDLIARDLTASYMWGNAKITVVDSKGFSHPVSQRSDWTFFTQDSGSLSFGGRLTGLVNASDVAGFRVVVPAAKR